MTAPVQDSAGLYRPFVLPVDDLTWTKHWLGRLRCDQILVSIATEAAVQPQVRIVAIESKSSSETEPLTVSPDVKPLEEAGLQVLATLDALASALDPTETDRLVADLRHASFVEHLSAVVLAELHPLLRKDQAAKHIIRTIGELSRRKLSLEDDVALSGLAVVTQYRAAVSQEFGAFDLPRADGDGTWRVIFGRTGTQELQSLLGKGSTSYALPAGAGPEPDGAGSDAAPLQSGDTYRDASAVSTDEEPGPVAPVVSESEEPAPVAPALSKNEEPTPAASAVAAGDESTVAPATSPIAASTVAAHAVEASNTSEDAETLAQSLLMACRARGIDIEAGERGSAVVGPTVVSLPMALPAGSNLRKIEAATDDIARELGVKSVAVENDPDRAFHVRFLVARRERTFPSLPAVPPRSDASGDYLGLHLGVDLAGEAFVSFLSSWPHGLIAGTSGSGKTTFLRSLLRQLALVPPGEVQAVILDGKGETDYLGVLPEHSFAPQFPDVLMDQQQASSIFEWLVDQEMPRRREVLRQRAAALGTRVTARQLFASDPSETAATLFAPLVVVVDEFQQLMEAGSALSGPFEAGVQNVVQVGRSLMVHLLLATQAPSVKVVSGRIKANLDARVALALPTFNDSMTILGSKGAEQLLGRGDMLFKRSGQPNMRLQGYGD